MSVLKEKYDNTVLPALKATGRFANPMTVPRLKKVVINMGVDAQLDRDLLKAVTEDLAKIAGQKPVTTHATKSIANFKLREGMPIGAKVTLRGVKMYEFLERLIRVSLPRIRDFNGISEKMDGQGNYTLGLKEQIIFPEIDIDKNPRIHGLEITFVTTAKTDEEAYALLKEFGIPFKKHNK